MALEPSPFAKVFKTNYAPTLSEVSWIQQKIAAHKSRLSTIEDELFIARSIMSHHEHMRLRLDNSPAPSTAVSLGPHLPSPAIRSLKLKQEFLVVRNTVAELLKERGSLQDFIENHRVFISPIRRMPAEVMSEIFLWCIPEDGFARFAKEDAVPLWVGCVCKGWRHIAHSTPRLWASLDIGSCPTPSYAVKCLSLWLSRSGSLPLSFRIRGTNWYHTKNVQPFEPTIGGVIEILAEHSARWKCVDVELQAQWTVMLLSPLSRGLPLLESVRFFEAASHGYPAVIIDLSCTPRLKTVAAHGNAPFMGVFFHFGQTMAHSVQEVSFNGTCLSFDDFFFLLQHCPSLKSCCVELGVRVNDEQRLNAGYEMLTLPDLDVLNLHINSGLDPGHLLDKLRLPSLTHLTLLMPERPKEQSWPHIASLLRRSGALLQSLDISGGPIEEGDLLDCLQYAPRLRSLCALGVPLTDATPAALMLQPPGDGYTSLVPDLENLELSKCWSLSTDVVVSMVVSRCKMSEEPPPAASPAHSLGQLSRVRLWNCQGASFDGNDELEACIINGLDFFIKTGWGWR